MLRRWTASSRTYLVTAAALSLVVVMLLRGYAARSAAAAASGPAVGIVVAATPIARGEALTRAGLRTERIPQAYAPPGVIARVTQAAGRVALSDFAPGEAVTQTRLTRVRAGPVASLTPEGLRAFAVPTSLPQGAVRAGDHVDLLATYGGSQPHTETVVTGVQVLLVLGPGGTGGQTDKGASAIDAAGADASITVTLVVLVGPEQETRLAYARAFANLDVAIAPASPG